MIRNKIQIGTRDLSNLAKLRSMLPPLSVEETDFIENLPVTFKIECPYFVQEEKHFSGAACVQMLCAFHGDSVPDQRDVASMAGWDNWRFQNHESLSEDLVRHMARRNFIPAIYYPGRHVLPKFPVGIDGVDFISGNRDTMAEVDFSYFKALLVNSQAPLFIRVHFDTTMYPMPEEMAQRLDHTGHGVIIVGYNENGFIINDPWNKADWGGTRGGKESFISFYELRHSVPTVNCCLDLAEQFTKLQAFFEAPHVAVFQNRDIDIDVVVQSIGIKGIQSDIYALEDISVTLRFWDGLICRSPLRVQAADKLLPGTEVRLPISITTGDRTGSYPIYARIQGTLNIPAYPWEEMGRTESITIFRDIATRIDIKDKEWLNRYGRF